MHPNAHSIMNANAIFLFTGLLLCISSNAQVELIEMRTPCHGGQSQGFSTAVKGDYVIFGGLDYTEIHRKCLNGYTCVWQGPPSTDVAISNTHFALGRAQGTHPGGDVWVGTLQALNDPLIQVAVDLNDFTSGQGDALAFAGNDLVVHTANAVRVFTAPAYSTSTQLVVNGLTATASLDADENGGYREVVVPTVSGVAIFRKGVNWPMTPTYFTFPNTYSLDVVLNDGVIAVSGFDVSGGTVMHFLRRNAGIWMHDLSESFVIPPGSLGEIAGYFHIAMDQGQLFVNDYIDGGVNMLKGFTRNWVFLNGNWTELGQIDENSSYSFPHSGSLGMDADDGVLSICDFPLQRYFLYRKLNSTEGGPTISSCGSLNDIPIATTQLQCSAIANATNYRFQFTTPCGYLRNMPTGNGIPSISINFLTHRLEPCMTYQVKAQAYVDGEWMNFGPECTMTTAGCQTPALQLAPDFCGATLSLDEWIQANRVLGGYSYQFEFTGIPGTMTAGYGPRYLATNVQTTVTPYDQDHPTSECPLDFYTLPLTACGSYHVRVRRVLGCSTQCGFGEWGPTCTISIDGNCMPLEPHGLNTRMAREEKFMVLPNPAQDGRLVILMTNFIQDGSVSISVRDASGRRVLQPRVLAVSDGEMRCELDMSGYASGIYFVGVDDGRQLLWQQFVLE